MRKPTRIRDSEDLEARGDAFNDDGEEENGNDANPEEAGGDNESGNEKEEREIRSTVDVAAEVRVSGPE